MPIYNQLNEAQLRDLLIGSNAVIANDSPFNVSALSAVNNGIFHNDPTVSLNAQTDSAGGNVTLQAGTHIFLENTAAPGDISLTTFTNREAVVLNTAGGVNFTDQGSTHELGGFIFGDNSNGNTITVVHGANYVVAGSGLTTLQGGSGADTLWGGGQSVVKGGTGDGQHLRGGLSTGAMDTLIGGSGSATLTAVSGNDVLIAGGGVQSLMSGTSGNDIMYGNGESRLKELGANVTMYAGTGANAHDTLRGGMGFDSMVTTAGSNKLVAGPGVSSISSGGNDSIYVTQGGYQQINSTGADTIYVGLTTTFDTITAGTAATRLSLSQDLGQGTLAAGQNGSTILSFSNGTAITYSGNVTIHFGHQDFTS